MAICDEGYPCEICKQDVDGITESDLYLRYVLGEVRPEALHRAAERHLRCNPTLTQFIVDPRFEPIHADGMFDKRNLDLEFVTSEETRISRGYRRLHEIVEMQVENVLEYPLPEVIARWQLEIQDVPDLDSGATR